MRAIWKGAINFGLLNVPVKLSSATEKDNVSFRMLHRECSTPIKEKRFCPVCNKEVSAKEIAKGYEFEPGSFVVLSEAELQNLPVKSNRYIQIVNFIKLAQVDPIYFIKTYYLSPETGAEKPYLILRNAMRDTGRAAVAKVTMRNKEHLCLIRLVDDAISLSTMFFPDEVRQTDELGLEKALSKVKILEAESEMAIKLVENLTADFDPNNYHDEYRAQLLALVQAKVEGRQTVSAKQPDEAPMVIDLMEKLRASVEATSGEKKRAKAAKKKSAPEKSVAEKKIKEPEKPAKKTRAG